MRTLHQLWEVMLPRALAISNLCLPPKFPSYCCCAGSPWVGCGFVKEEGRGSWQAGLRGEDPTSSGELDSFSLRPCVHVAGFLVLCS